MSTLLKLIDDNFGQGEPPTEAMLISHTGADPLDKRATLEKFLGKSKEEVLAGIKSADGYGDHWDLEKLLFMDPMGLSYYLWPYMRYLIESAGDYEKDGEMTEHLLSFIRSILGLHGSSYFTEQQCEVIRTFTLELMNKFGDVRSQSIDTILHDANFIVEKLR